MDEPRQTLDEFLDAHPCTLAFERAGLTPDKKGDVFAFMVTIARENRTVTVPYTMGIGHAKDPTKGKFRHHFSGARHERDGFWYGIFGATWKKIVLWPEPDLRGVLCRIRLHVDF